MTTNPQQPTKEQPGPWLDGDGFEQPSGVIYRWENAHIWERLYAANVNALEAEVAQLRAWGQQVHDALDGKPLPELPDEAPARIAQLRADNLRLRGLDESLRGEAQRQRDEYADEVVTLTARLEKLIAEVAQLRAERDAYEGAAAEMVARLLDAKARLEASEAKVALADSTRTAFKLVQVNAGSPNAHWALYRPVDYEFTYTELEDEVITFCQLYDALTAATPAEDQG